MRMASRPGRAAAPVVRWLFSEKQSMKEKSRPILCGIDFSAVSVEAMEVAAAMARRCETKLVLLHVEEYSGMAEVDTRIFEDALAQAWSDLEKEAARLRALGTEVEIKLLSGSVFDELV